MTPTFRVNSHTPPSALSARSSTEATSRRPILTTTHGRRFCFKDDGGCGLYEGPKTVQEQAQPPMPRHYTKRPLGRYALPSNIARTTSMASTPSPLPPNNERPVSQLSASAQSQLSELSNSGGLRQELPAAKAPVEMPATEAYEMQTPIQSKKPPRRNSSSLLVSPQSAGNSPGLGVKRHDSAGLATPPHH